MLGVNTHAAPAKALSRYPPATAVFPSADSATDHPWAAGPTSPVPTSLAPCWLHTPALRVYTHAAPTSLLSANPPTIAVFPSADSATASPCGAAPTAPVPTSLAPCWLHPPALRVYPHAAPVLLKSLAPPTIAVFPSADTATETPCCEAPTPSVPTSLAPCWLHTPPL